MSVFSVCRACLYSVYAVHVCIRCMPCLSVFGVCRACLYSVYAVHVCIRCVLYLERTHKILRTRFIKRYGRLGVKKIRALEQNRTVASPDSATNFCNCHS